MAAPIEILPIESLELSALSLAVYGDPESELADLEASIRVDGVLVPLVVAPRDDRGLSEVISGNRRLACARRLGISNLACEIKAFADEPEKQRAMLVYNRQRRKRFSQLMREADLLEAVEQPKAAERRAANLRQNQNRPDRRNSDNRQGRADETIAQLIGLGGKDLYRQARSIWKAVLAGDTRAQSSLILLDREEKTIHAAYKDLRRRDRFSANFKPTPYDVWSFRHDRAFGIPHPGAIPPAIVAHTLYYYTNPGGIVVDPMAGGGTTIDVCASMGRRCLAYDIEPSRSDIKKHDVRSGIPVEASGCDLIFLDPPYHTMLVDAYGPETVAGMPFSGWVEFLEAVASAAFETLAPGGHIALLLANQTEKDLPRGFGYLDHAFYGYQAIVKAGFLPQRRISCPMSGAFLPQHVRKAREEGRLLGQVRDLLIARKPT